MSSASFSSRPGPKFTALKSDRLLSPGSVTPPRRSGWKSPVSLRLDSPRTAGGGTDTASGPRLSRGRRRRPDGVHVSRGWGWGWVGSAAMGGGTARNVEGRVIGVALAMNPNPRYRSGRHRSMHRRRMCGLRQSGASLLRTLDPLPLL
eukprot:EG_transcript_25490